MWSDEEIYYATPLNFTEDKHRTESPGPVSTAQLDTDSEDNIPLAEIQKRSEVRSRRLSVKRKLIEGETDEETDDSLNDKTYKPSKDDVNSSDSEQNDFSMRTNAGKNTKDRD